MFDTPLTELGSTSGNWTVPLFEKIVVTFLFQKNFDKRGWQIEVGGNVGSLKEFLQCPVNEKGVRFWGLDNWDCSNKYFLQTLTGTQVSG